MMRLIVSSVVSSSSAAPASESATLTAAEVLPVWLECASSMMMAKRRPRCSFPISSRMKGNFCTVEMMIFLPLSINARRLAERFGMADGGPDLGELFDRVADLLVEDASVRDHDDGIEHPGGVLPEPDQLVGEPGDGVRLSRCRPSAG